MAIICYTWFLPEEDDDNDYNEDGDDNGIDDDLFPFWGWLGNLGLKDIGFCW